MENTTNPEANMLNKIHPTSHAPYALRFITDDFKVGQAGAAAVNFRFSLANNAFTAQISTYDGEAWRWVATEETDMRNLDEYEAAGIAEQLIEMYV